MILYLSRHGTQAEPGGEWAQPTTKAGMWCGEYQPRTPLPVVVLPTTLRAFADAYDAAVESKINEWTWPNSVSRQQRTRSMNAVKTVLLKEYFRATCFVIEQHPNGSWEHKPPPPLAAELVAAVGATDLATVVRRVVDESRKSQRATYLREVLAANGHSA